MKNITQNIKRTVIIGLLVLTAACAGNQNNDRYTQAGQVEYNYNNDGFYGVGDRY